MIMYFAGAEAPQYNKLLRDNEVESALFSYYSISASKLATDGFFSFKRVFLDSGAFSAMTRGAEIKLESYIEFIVNNRHRLTVYAPLDVIGDSKATQVNYDYMKQMGLDPVFVFHYGSDFSILEEYINKVDYIALGGMVGKTRKQLIPFLNKCFSIARTNWPIKFHGFGMTSSFLMRKYPFYSVDSTSWLSPARFGGIMEYNGTAAIVEDNEYNRRLNKLLDYNDKLTKSITVYKKVESDITDLWKLKGITWNE